ncbi:hypothetical protein N7517_003855 [Penicillium concentricum]|uniref:RNase H type-1 domain-containing protein n=1 Tax=Penicillium concentricum TaxID=293559 RepID=A0A9W9S6I2_9EURO|nr:uncharacterized protein N7517_003855 [Penicillium concentricum]KAJ5371849.1 hypothetical protein N7517_003855 [Penicillium concentricum]
MDFNMGNKRLMALVLFFFSYLTFCLSVPTNPFASLSDQAPKRIPSARSLNAHHRGFMKRADETYAPFLADLAIATRVEQEDEKFMAFGADSAILASDGFSGCVGVVIASSQGAIIAHYTDTESGMNQARENLARLITENKKALWGAQAWIYAHVRLEDPSTYVSEANNLALESIVEDNLNIVPTRVKYIEPEDTLNDLMEGPHAEDYFDGLIEPELLYGAVMVKHQGGKSTNDVIFINLDWQKAASDASIARATQLL